MTICSPRACLAATTAAFLGACASAQPAPTTPAPPTTAPVPADYPAPAEVLGYPVGTDRRLADWTEVIGYMEALAERSPRVLLDTLGETTLGRPFIMLTISSEENLARLDELHDVQMRLADPRTIGSDAEAEELIERGRAIVLITASIHSTEVGASQVPMLIAHRLATSERELERDIRDNVITLLVPSLNPDGVQLVVDWYESTLGQDWEGASPPFLYHHYVGHDNNRDWYYFSQIETQLTIEGAHNAWHPQIVHDIHQMGSDGARLFIPPWIDPVEPNVDPLLIESINDIGTHMAWYVGLQGLEGVVVNATYDAWTPARAYQHYHAGARILTETASANMASPIVIPFEELDQGRNFHAQVASWNFPDPWPGGEWTLGDIVTYMEAGAFGLLQHAADNREQWLRSFLKIGQNAVGGWERWPEAWVIPADQENEPGVRELLRVLVMGDVEVQRAGRDFSAGGRAFPAGSWVIRMQQPYASFAQTMLERQDYPDLRQYPGGPPRQPYDVTAHTLPLLLGVDAVALETLPSPETLALAPPLAEPLPTIRDAQGFDGPGAPRVALYNSFGSNMDEGWTRWIFDQYGVGYERVDNADILSGALAERFDVVVFASESPRMIIQGRREGTVPDSLVGGLGAEGIAEVRRFVEGGGTAVMLEEASLFAIDAFDLPLRSATAELPDEEFFIPGSILALSVDTSHPIGAAMPPTTAAWFGEDSMALEPTADDTRLDVVARYGESDPLLSGWALGIEHVAGRPAVVEADIGQGHVVLFGFKPQYRAQTVATFPLLFGALEL